MKKMMTLAAVVLLAGCANANTTGSAAPPAVEPTPENVSQAIEEAKAAAAKADSVGYQWRDTSDFIKEAEELAKKGEYEEALQLARKAERQGELAYQQWQRETQGTRQN